MNEISLYPEVIKWFKIYLQSRHSHSRVEVYDTQKINLSRLIFELNLHRVFPEYNAFDIKIDVTALIRSKKKINLAFLECKIKPITLRDVGQILGYSRVAQPEYTFLISPEGISGPLSTLLRTFGRYDILEYDRGKRIRIAQWNADRKEIDSSTLLPPGEFIHPK
jgi:hypothetical protein